MQFNSRFDSGESVADVALRLAGEVEAKVSYRSGKDLYYTIAGCVSAEKHPTEFAALRGLLEEFERVSE